MIADCILAVARKGASFEADRGRKINRGKGASSGQVGSVSADGEVNVFSSIHCERAAVASGMQKSCTELDTVGRISQRAREGSCWSSQYVGQQVTRSAGDDGNDRHAHRCQDGNGGQIIQLVY